ncbi:DUF397 domain-containing protein [Streptomyces sp. NPDC020802]|uniref:DUF397 domain-containing protein n=1 Tax=Streptomyces sp. NPDC020802 TaxID=3365094 RepID=UPI0037981190
MPKWLGIATFRRRRRGGCMELDGAELQWRKSSATNGGNCVEVAFADHVAVRDSHYPERALLGFSAYAWHSFLGVVKDSGSEAIS